MVSQRFSANNRKIGFYILHFMYVKSQLILGVSIITAIAFVGCIFELSSGEPQWGSLATWSILLTSLPATVLCFITAVKMARASMKDGE
jgi:heme/copper-type cytochrome/quinol oxidase subunit 2